MSKQRTGKERPVGRRPGDSAQTKAAILTAAREAFSVDGFDRATIRSIATTAKVDPALVMHYFKSKQNLFAQAHELPFSPSELFAGVLELPSGLRAAELTRTYLSMLAFGPAPGLSLIRAAATNEDAARMMREFLSDALLTHASTLAPGSNGQRRLALVGAHLIGVAFARQILGLDVLKEADIDQLVNEISPAIQTYLDI